MGKFILKFLFINKIDKFFNATKLKQIAFNVRLNV